MRAGDLAQDVAVLEQAAAAQELLAQQAVEASHTLAAGLSLELQRTHAFKQVIAAHMNGEPHPCCSSNGGLWLQPGSWQRMFWEISSQMALGACQLNVSRLNPTFTSWVQLFTHSPASFLLSSPSCKTRLALPMTLPPRLSPKEKLCSPMPSPSWPAWKVRASPATTWLSPGDQGTNGQFGDSQVAPTGMKKVLGHRKSQAALRKRMATVRDRVMVDAQRKIKQAKKTLGNSLSISTTAQRTAGEAEQVSEESAKV